MYLEKVNMYLAICTISSLINC